MVEIHAILVSLGFIKKICQIYFNEQIIFIHFISEYTGYKVPKT